MNGIQTKTSSIQTVCIPGCDMKQYEYFKNDVKTNFNRDILYGQVKLDFKGPYKPIDACENEPSSRAGVDGVVIFCLADKNAKQYFTET